MDRTPMRELARLARRLGVRRSYADGLGQRRVAPVESVYAVMRALGTDVSCIHDAAGENRRLDAAASSTLCAPTVVSWTDAPPRVDLRPAARKSDSIDASLRTERGDVREWRTNSIGVALDIPLDVPVGRHTLRLRAGRIEQEATLFRAPTRCARPASLSRCLAAFLPLYAVRKDAGVGLGDVGDLARLASWAGDRGCALLATLPLLACFLDDPLEPSPYAPVSRAVFGEHFIDLHAAATRVGEGALARLLRSPEFLAESARARAGDLVDYRASWRLTRTALDAAASDVFASDALRVDVESFARQRPTFAAYAAFRAARAPGDPDRERRLFLCAQWLLREQLGALSSAPGAALYLDLPVGAHRDGFDAHRAPAIFPRAVSMGAPPDALFTLGQNWGFPPVSPVESLRTGHALFVESIEAHLEHARALRIDHAGGLHRAFWIPEGAEASDGVYVEMPSESLYAALAVLSHRHDALIVGEDLGSVPESSRRAMDEHAVARMHIVQFDLGSEDAPLPEAPEGTLAALNTHDMPTIAAHLQGEDIDLLLRLGLLTEDDASTQRTDRAARRARAVCALLDRAALDPAHATDDRAIVEALLAWLSEGDATVVLVSLEDLWLERTPQNVPGITDGFPAWRRRAAPSIDDITTDPRLAGVLERLAAARSARAVAAEGD